MAFEQLLARACDLQERTRRRFPRLPVFITLARLDRPIGIYLLLWPTLGALWFAASGWPGWHLFLVFFAGAVLTRSAGCVVNDIADRNLDGLVTRTRNRPLATGQVSPAEALVFCFALLFLALLLVLTTNLLTLVIALVAALIAGVYPFMKRYTYLPQVVLGLAFSGGIVMAFAAHTNNVPTLAWLLLVANVVWTVAYDTEYAMVDRDDDIRAGIKSSAILFGDLDRVAIGTLQILFVYILYLVGKQIEAGTPFHVSLGLASLLLIYQQYLIRDRQEAHCFQAFLNNHWVGLVLFGGIVFEFALRNP